MGQSTVKKKPRLQPGPKDKSLVAQKIPRGRPSHKRVRGFHWELTFCKPDVQCWYESKFPQYFEELHRPARCILAAILHDKISSESFAGVSAKGFSRPFRDRLSGFVRSVQKLHERHDVENIYIHGISEVLGRMFHLVEFELAPLTRKQSPLPEGIVPKTARRMTRAQILRWLVDTPTADFMLSVFYSEAARRGWGPRLNQQEVAERVIPLTKGNRTRAAVIVSLRRFRESPKSAHARSEVRRLFRIVR